MSSYAYGNIAMPCGFEQWLVATRHTMLAHNAEEHGILVHAILDV